MPQFTDNVSLRAGATPQTFDGNGTFRFNDRGSRVTGLSIGHSMSAYTTEEGFVMAAKLSENAGLGSKAPIFFLGMVGDAGPATNKSVRNHPPDYIPLDIPIAGGSTMRIDLSTVAGATQTGTHDCSITIHYDSGDTPSDILAAAAGASGVVPVRGGTYGYTTALATTTETALTGNGSTLNIPGEAREVVAFVGCQVLDTAVTAAEELGGKCRLEFSGIASAGKQEYPLNGGMPNAGTEVEGCITSPLRRLPMYLPNRGGTEIQTSGYITFLSAITGGADAAVNLLWR